VGDIFIIILEDLLLTKKY